MIPWPPPFHLNESLLPAKWAASLTSIAIFPETTRVHFSTHIFHNATANEPPHLSINRCNTSQWAGFSHQMHYSHGGPLRIDRGICHHRSRKKIPQYAAPALCFAVSTYHSFSHLYYLRAETVKLSYLSYIYIYSIHLYARLIFIVPFVYSLSLGSFWPGAFCFLGLHN